MLKYYSVMGSPAHDAGCQDPSPLCLLCYSEFVDFRLTGVLQGHQIPQVSVTKQPPVHMAWLSGQTPTWKRDFASHQDIQPLGQRKRDP